LSRVGRRGGIESARGLEHSKTSRFPGLGRPPSAGGSRQSIVKVHPFAGLLRWAFDSMLLKLSSLPDYGSVETHQRSPCGKSGVRGKSGSGMMVSRSYDDEFDRCNPAQGV